MENLANSGLTSEGLSAHTGIITHGLSLWSLLTILGSITKCCPRGVTRMLKCSSQLISLLSAVSQKKRDDDEASWTPLGKKRNRLSAVHVAVCSGC